MSRRILAVLMLSLVCAAADAYDFAPFQYPGSLSTSPAGINDSGEVVGTYKLSPPSLPSAPASGFLYTGSGFTDFNHPGAGSTSPAAINSSGHIAGLWREPGQWPTHGFVYDTGTFTSFDLSTDLSTKLLTQVHGMNNLGQIVGSYYEHVDGPVPVDDVPHGFIKDASGVRNIDVPGAIQTWPYGINDNGDIVGTYFTPTTGAHGFIWKNGTFSTIDHPDAVGGPWDSGAGTHALDVNNAGQIVGYFLKGGTWHGYVYQNGIFTTIDVPNSPVTYILAINNIGVIVGKGTDGFIGTPNDPDGDGIDHASDNCTLVANSSQHDADGDGFGNRCDGDLNNNNFTNAQDYVIFRSRLGTTDPHADLNGNGTVNAEDDAIFRTLLGAPAGPSGLVP